MRRRNVRKEERKKTAKEVITNKPIRIKVTQTVIDRIMRPKPNQRMIRMKLKETSELVLWIAHLANTMGEVLEDGKISLLELPKFYAPIMGMPAAIQGMKELPAELKDVSKEELALLIEEVKKTLDLPQERVEMIVEKALELGLVLFTIIKSFKK